MNKILPVAIGMGVIHTAVLTAERVSLAKLKAKKTGTPSGTPGSLDHIVSNDKIVNKRACFAEINKQAVKDTFEIGALSAVAAAGSAVAVASSSSAKVGFNNFVSKVGKNLSKVSINDKSLKDIVKNTKVFNKFNSLPTPAKAAIVVGGGLFAILSLALNSMISGQSAYIEAQNEEK